MASPSSTPSQKIIMVKAEDDASSQKKETIKNLQHVAIPYELIERLKNAKEWPGQRSFHGVYNEERVRRVWEGQRNMIFEELFDRVFYGDGEEIVWDDDVFGVQPNTEIIPQPQTLEPGVSEEKTKDD